MIAILVRESEVENPAFDPQACERARQAGMPYDVPHSLTVPAGTKIQRPDAWQLCLHGMAIPGDKECQTRCGMTDAQLQEAISRQAVLSSGMGYDLEAGKVTADAAADDEGDDADATQVAGGGTAVK